VDNPLLAGLQSSCVENPVLVSPGIPTPASYQEVFEKAVDILSEYFDLETPKPDAGQIIAKPRIAPGYEQFWKSGNPDPNARLLATLQTIRQSARIDIRPGEHGGFLVFVIVERELEDLARPTQSRAGIAVFQEAATVARPFDVVTTDRSRDEILYWFKIGRDVALEQLILTRIRNGR
jgi:hypothetical protein